MIIARRLWIIPLLYLCACSVAAQSTDAPTGVQIMQEVQRRHQLGKSVYEEVTLILTDRLGNRNTRDLRRYSSTDISGNTRMLLLFDTPVDAHGVALLANRDVNGETTVMVYLPASGKPELQQIDPGADGNIIGTDFSLEQMIGERLQHHQYVLHSQLKIGNINHFLIDVYAANDNIASAGPIRRHYVREDAYYITRTDYLASDGRLLKQKTLHDLRQTGPQSWRAGMVLMENRAGPHSTLLKVKRTIFSSEYVPDEVFTQEWLYHNQPPIVVTEAGDGTVVPELIQPATDPEYQQSAIGTGVR